MHLTLFLIDRAVVLLSRNNLHVHNVYILRIHPIELQVKLAGAGVFDTSVMPPRAMCRGWRVVRVVQHVSRQIGLFGRLDVAGEIFGKLKQVLWSLFARQTL